MSLRQTTSNTPFNIFLFIAFWFVLTIECYGLYKKEYSLYTYSRMGVSPILIIRILTSEAKKANLYALFVFFFSLFADGFVIFGNSVIANLGLSLFSLSYLVMGCYFNQIKQNHNLNNVILGVFTAVLVMVNLLWTFAPELQSKVFYMQVLVHSCIILFITYSLVQVYNRLKGINVLKLFTYSVALIILTNLIYAIDVLFLKRAYPLIDAFVGLGNGLYLYFFTKAVFASIKRNV